jgi:MFS transporter, DHA1 family, tetracycline resistance protein
VIEGLTAGSISAMYAYVADTKAPDERGAAFGLLGAAAGLGFMCGPALGGIAGQLSVSAPLYVAAALAVLNGLWVFLRYPKAIRVRTARRGLIGDISTLSVH